MVSAASAPETWIVVGVSGWRRDRAANGVMPVTHESLRSDGWLIKLVLVLLAPASLLRGLDRGELHRNSGIMISGGYRTTGRIEASDRSSVKVGRHFVQRK